MNQPLPSKVKQLAPSLLTLLGAGTLTAGAAGVGIDNGTSVETWPMIIGGIMALVTSLGTSRSNFITAMLAPPVDAQGNGGARFTCSIALAQAHREGEVELVNLLAQTVKKAKPAQPAPEPEP